MRIPDCFISVPDEPQTELNNLAASTLVSSGNTPVRGDGCPCLLCTYAAEEVRRKERVVEIDVESGWVAVVPFWAVWPFETLCKVPRYQRIMELANGLQKVLPYKRHIPSLIQLNDNEIIGLARILQRLLVRYDNLFS